MSLELGLGIAGVVLALLAFPFGYYVRGLGEKNAELYWDYQDESLWDPEMSGSDRFTLDFEGRPIEKARKSVVYLWSAGPGGFSAADVSVTDPVRLIYPTGINILSASVTAQVRSGTNFSCNIGREDDDRQQIVVQADFVDTGDGARIEVLSEDLRQIAPSPDDEFIPRTRRFVKVEMVGAIKGVRHGFREAPDYTNQSQSIFYWLSLANGLAFTIGGAVVLAGISTFFPAGPFGQSVPLGISLLLGGVLVIGISRWLERRIDGVAEYLESRNRRVIPKTIEQRTNLRFL